MPHFYEIELRVRRMYLYVRLSSKKTFVSKLSLRKLNYGLVSSPAFINGCIDGDGKGRETVTIQWKAGHSKLDGGNDFERHFTEQMTEEKSRAAVAAAENQEDISARGTPIILSLDPLSWCLANAYNHICLEDQMNPQKSPIKARIVGLAAFLSNKIVKKFFFDSIFIFFYSHSPSLTLKSLLCAVLIFQRFC